MIDTSALSSHSVRLRLVEEDDADFILSLRLDPLYNKHLSSVDDDLEKQRQWIKTYKSDEDAGIQYYFIIERLDGTTCGTVRVYDLKPDSFCWGSWILNDNKTRFAAIETALLIYKFGFEILGYPKSHFEVIKENEKVVSFHRKFGAIQTHEDETNFYFELPQNAYEEQKEKLKKFL